MSPSEGWSWMAGKQWKRCLAICNSIEFKLLSELSIFKGSRKGFGCSRNGERNDNFHLAIPCPANFILDQLSSKFSPFHSSLYSFHNSTCSKERGIKDHKDQIVPRKFYKLCKTEYVRRILFGMSSKINQSLPQPHISPMKPIFKREMEKRSIKNFYLAMLSLWIYLSYFTIVAS